MATYNSMFTCMAARSGFNPPLPKKRKLTKPQRKAKLAKQRLKANNLRKQRCSNGSH